MSENNRQTYRTHWTRHQSHLPGTVGSLNQRSSMNVLMFTHTSAQRWLRERGAYNQPALRPLILGNNIDEACNCIVHQRLSDILTHFRVHKELIKTIASFTSKPGISLKFEGQREPLPAFRSGLRQGSPRSPVPFVSYTAALKLTGQQLLNRHVTLYINDELMTQGATSQ